MDMREHEAEGVRGPRKTTDAECSVPGPAQARRNSEGNLGTVDPSLSRPDGRIQSKVPDQEVRFNRTKSIVLYGPETPPKEALGFDTAKVLPLALKPNHFCRLWMLDSGASYDVIRRRDLTLKEQSSERDASIVAPLKNSGRPSQRESSGDYSCEDVERRNHRLRAG